MEPFFGTGADPGFISNSAPTNPNYWPFGNTCEVDEVSPEVAIGGVAGHRCLQPEGVQDDSRTTTQGSLEILNPIMLNSVKLVIFIIFSRENNNIIII
jgi:hypothetical protein